MDKINIIELSGIAKDFHKNTNKGFMGVSIRNKFFSNKNMEIYFPWIEEHFNEFVVLLMDEPDRHNLEIFKSLMPEEALKKSKEISNYLKFGYEKILKKHKLQKIKILSYTDIKEDDFFKEIDNCVNDLFQSDNSFRVLLLKQMEINIGDRIAEYKIQNGLMDTQLINYKLINYIKEEIAPLIYLTEKGYRVEVDPHEEFIVKKDIYSGKYKQFKNIIKNSGHINLQISRDSYFKLK